MGVHHSEKQFDLYILLKVSLFGNFYHFKDHVRSTISDIPSLQILFNEPEFELQFYMSLFSSASCLLRFIQEEEAKCMFGIMVVVKFMINAHYILSVELHIITNLCLLVYGKSDDEQTK